MNLENKKITIKDIATVLGIHHSTVSRALNNHPDVNAKTKILVKQMAKKLDYHPNLFARNLKTNKTNVIGVIVPEIKHFFFASVISGIEEIAHREGYALLLSQSNENYEREVINTRALVSNRVAGLLVSISQTTKDDSHFKELQKNDIELVFFDRVMPDFNASKVVVDDYKGAYTATEYLIKKGYKKIAHIGGSRNFIISEKRHQGYVDALKKHEMAVNCNLVYFGGFHEKNGVEGIRYLLEGSNKPDAVFAVNDPVALGAYDEIKKRGLKIPKDIAVIGFSNNPVSALVAPPLTTIKQPAYEMGKEAAELLFKQMKNKTNNIEEKILKTYLIERSSA